MSWVMRLSVMAFVLFLAGCGSDKDRNKNRDKDRPKRAPDKVALAWPQ